MRLDGDDVTRSERIKARGKLPELEEALKKAADESTAKKEFKEKEGIVDEGYKREDRWNFYLEEQERKKEQEAKEKEESMFRDYNQMVEEAKNVSAIVEMLTMSVVLLETTTFDA